MGILAIESFVGQNIEELGEFGKGKPATGFRKLLATYSERVVEDETDRSFLISLPEDL